MLRQWDDRCLTQGFSACRGFPEETSGWEPRAGSSQLSEGGKEYSRQRQQLHQGPKTTEGEQGRGHECDLIWLDHRIYACMWACVCVCVCICLCVHMPTCWNRRGQRGEPGEGGTHWLMQNKTLSIKPRAMGPTGGILNREGT